MATIYLAIRDGKVVTTSAFEARADGTLWTHGLPLLDSQGEGFSAIGREKIAELCKAGRFGEIPATCFAHQGMNPSGLKVLTQAEYKQQALAARTPAQVERDRISGLYAKAQARQNASDDGNVSDYYRIMGEADAALKAWRETYPTEAREEKAQGLDAEAEHEEEMAAGALRYDSDGWLDEAARKTRHDEMMAKAKEIRAQAAVLRAQKE